MTNRRQKDLAETYNTVEKVRKFHKSVGTAIASCSWEDYSATLVSFYGCSLPVLESMRRLGHFMVTSSSVAYH